MLADSGLHFHFPHFRPRHWLGSTLERLAAQEARHRARCDLARLDPHLLRDIGLTDADVAAELRRTGAR